MIASSFVLFNNSVLIVDLSRSVDDDNDCSWSLDDDDDDSVDDGSSDIERWSKFIKLYAIPWFWSFQVQIVAFVSVWHYCACV